MRFQSSMLQPVLLLYCSLPGVLGLHRDRCAADIAQKLHNGSLKFDDSIFYRQKGYIIMSNITNIELTLPGCEAQCGSAFNWYDDIGPRLTTWLIPVVLLIGNLCLATLGKPNSIFTIIHLLGDPLDSMWSLLTKLESWNRCLDLAEDLSKTGAVHIDHVRDRGTILAAIQEVEGPGNNPSDTYTRIITNSTLDGDDPLRPRLHHLCREIANELSDSSINELPRTLLAIMSYIFAILSAFVDAIGGKSSSQPGGRIASAIFLSWLLPVILLSNSIGSFTSRRTLVRILERFAKATKPVLGQQSVIPSPPSQPKASRSPNRFGVKSRSSDRSRSESITSPPMFALSPPANPMVSILGPNETFHPSPSTGYSPRRPSAETDYLDLQIFSQDRPSTLFGKRAGNLTSFDNAQPWSGGIYTYQSSKRLFTVPQFQKRARNPFTLLFIAALPILAASVTAFLILWFTPTVGLTCRHAPLLIITLLWLTSTMLGHITWKTFATGRYHWIITLVKDVFVAGPALLMIFLMSSGIFNSCYCWSSVWSRGTDAYVQLDPDKDRKRNAETIYPALVWGCLGFQALVFWISLRISKRGRAMMRRDEKTKMRDFWNVHWGVETERRNFCSVHRAEETEDERRMGWGSRGGSRGEKVRSPNFSARGVDGSGGLSLEMLPPPAETSPFLRI